MRTGKIHEEDADMATRTLVESTEGDTFADLLERLGNVPLDRIRMHPAPGTATEADVIAALEAANKRLYELVEGVLVEKAVGTKESLLGLVLGQRLLNFLDQNDLGLVFGADGAVRLMKGLVRIPDVSFVSWQRLPDGMPDEALASVVPDLAVEVLSRSNTKGEIQRKLRDYFLTGVTLAWVVNPRTETAEVYRAPDRKKRVGKAGTLDGAEVLPGFSLPLTDLFARATASQRKRRSGRNRKETDSHAPCLPCLRLSVFRGPARHSQSPARTAGHGAQGQGGHCRQAPRHGRNLLLPRRRGAADGQPDQAAHPH